MTKNEKEKKTLKERFEETKLKAKEFWEDNKDDIIAGGLTLCGIIGVGACGYFAVKGLSSNANDGSEILAKSFKGEDLIDDDEIRELIWKERDGDGIYTEIYSKLDELDEICKRRNVGLRMFTCFGEGASYDDGCIDIYIDNAMYSN